MEKGLLRDALSSILSHREDITVVSQHSRVDEAIKSLVSKQSDVLVTDLDPNNVRDSLRAVRRFKDAAPNCRVLALIDHKIAWVIREVLVGTYVQGFLSTASGLSTLITSIHDVFSGQQVVELELARAALVYDNPLTPREQDVMRHVMQGHTGPQIAKILHLGHGTVRNYISNALAKLGASTRIEGVRIAQNEGWL
jgi:two-component system response regulator DesR